MDESAERLEAELRTWRRLKSADLGLPISVGLSVTNVGTGLLDSEVIYALRERAAGVKDVIALSTLGDADEDAHLQVEDGTVLLDVMGATRV